jgi:hypothetical protein
VGRGADHLVGHGQVRPGGIAEQLRELGARREQGAQRLAVRGVAD